MQHTLSRKVALALLAGLLTLGLAACEEEQGPAEEAGEEIDQAVEEVGDSIEEATDN